MTSPSQRRKIDRIYGRPRRFDSPPTGPIHHTSVTQWARPKWRNGRGNANGSHRAAHGTTYIHRWSFQPVLQSEDHPVYIQPVKEHIIRRWKTFRPTSRNVASTAGSEKSLPMGPRKQKRTSKVSSIDSPLSTSGPSIKSWTSNAGPVGSSTASPEAEELDFTAEASTYVRPTPFLSASEPSTAYSSTSLTSPHSSSRLPNNLTRTLVDDDTPSYFSRMEAIFQTPSRTEEGYGRIAQRSSSTGTTLFSHP